MKKNRDMCYKNLSEREKNQLANQYQKLVVKITKQFYDKGLTTWDQLSSMAWEGFAIAINNFDEGRSKMNFTQYAAFAIRNNILTSLDNELRTVKLSNYAQKKVVEGGGTLWNSISLDAKPDNDDDSKGISEYKANAYTTAKFSDGDIFGYLYTRLNERFTTVDCKVFYMAFGLNGYEDTKGKDIAKEFGLSEAAVSQKLKKICQWIRKDQELCEMLQNLC